MTRLLALVADLLAGRRALGAVAREVASLAAVVAFAAVDAVPWTTVLAMVEITVRKGEGRTRHVADAAARVAGLVLVGVTTTAAAAVAVAAALATAATAVRRGTLGAVASDVANFTTLQIVSNYDGQREGFVSIIPCSTRRQTGHRPRRRQHRQTGGIHARCGRSGRSGSRSWPP